MACRLTAADMADTAGSQYRLFTSSEELRRVHRRRDHRQPLAVLLGRYDRHGTWRFLTQTYQLRAAQRREVAGLQPMAFKVPDLGRPWACPPPGCLAYRQVEPTLVTEGEPMLPLTDPSPSPAGADKALSAAMVEIFFKPPARRPSRAGTTNRRCACTRRFTATKGRTWKVVYADSSTKNAVSARRVQGQWSGVDGTKARGVAAAPGRQGGRTRAYFWMVTGALVARPSV